MGDCLTEKETLERIVRLETKVDDHKEYEEKALILAREILSKESALTRLEVDNKLEVHNQWQRRFDKLESKLALKDEVDKDFKRIDRLIWLAIGGGTMAGIIIGKFADFLF